MQIGWEFPVDELWQIELINIFVLFNIINLRFVDKCFTSMLIYYTQPANETLCLHYFPQIPLYW